MSYPHILLFTLAWSCSISYGRRHGSDIIQRPNDVIGAACGGEVRMTCVAKARGNTKEEQTPPDVEWWYRSPGSATTSSKKIVELDKEGKMSLHIEEFVVVRSTLIVKDVQPEDEGIYQCRASKSPQRYNQGVNVYQHWKIEEAPITGLQCSKDTTSSSITHVIPTEMYNISELDDIVTSTMSSHMTSSKSTSVKAFMGNSLPKKSATSRESHKMTPLSSTVSIFTSIKGSGSSTHYNNHTAGVWFAIVLCASLCLVLGWDAASSTN